MCCQCRPRLARYRSRNHLYGVFWSMRCFSPSSNACTLSRLANCSGDRLARCSRARSGISGSANEASFTSTLQAHRAPRALHRTPTESPATRCPVGRANTTSCFRSGCPSPIPAGQLPAFPEALRPARQWTNRTLQDWQLTESTQTVEQLVSELLANSIEHARTTSVGVCLIDKDRALLIEVERRRCRAAASPQGPHP